jgi:hypothetical protein
VTRLRSGSVAQAKPSKATESRRGCAAALLRRRDLRHWFTAWVYRVMGLMRGVGRRAGLLRSHSPERSLPTGSKPEAGPL